MNGNRESVDRLLENKRIIHRQEFGSTSLIGIFDELNDDEKLELKKNNIEISKIPLQKLFVYLTDNKEGEDGE